MPSLKNKLPSYRRHRPTGQAVVTLNGRDHYLGKHGTLDSRRAYERVITQWLAEPKHIAPQRERHAPGQLTHSLTIHELFLAYWSFATSYYVKDGKPTGELEPIRQSVKPLVYLYGPTDADQFGPLALEAVRQRMIDHDLCRKVINARVNRIRRMFKWGVSRQMVCPSVLHALQTLPPLKRGRCHVRESTPVQPIADSIVYQTIRHASPTIAAMIQLQLFTAMRPGEVTQMRTVDIDRSGDIWLYQPQSHKTAHHGKVRTIHLGPKAQQVLKPFVRDTVTEYLFSPQRAEQQRNEQRRANRQTRIPPSQARRRPKTNRNHAPGHCYTTSSYGKAIKRACDAAFPPPRSLARRLRGKRLETLQEWQARLGTKQWQSLQDWQRTHRWHPNQLRHNAATNLRKQFGLEAARVVLGHSSSAVTEIYAEQDHSKATDIMAKVG